DLGTHEGAPYIVSELLEGAELRAQLNEGALAARKVIDYALQTARGLSAAHEKGITHRDLKPENLFITTDGRVKILDFGLAKLTLPEAFSGEEATMATISPHPEPASIFGTPGYMAPEQLRGAVVDHRSDLFNLG